VSSVPARLALTLAGLLAAWPAWAQPAPGQANPDRPLIQPTRDVDITYRLGPAGIQERMRWSATLHLQRVDPPTPGLYAIVDSVSRRLTVVRSSDHTVLQLDSAPPGPAAALDDPATRFRRGGPDQVDGIACTNWQTTDSYGQDTVVCLTADGVLLRAVGGGRILLQAVSVSFAPLDPSAFQIPAGYAVVPLPPVHGG